MNNDFTTNFLLVDVFVIK